MPHYQPSDTAYHTYFRLAGSLPEAVIEKLRNERVEAERNALRERNLATRKELVRRIQEETFRKFDALLDGASSGPITLFAKVTCRGPSTMFWILPSISTQRPACVPTCSIIDGGVFTSAGRRGATQSLRSIIKARFWQTETPPMRSDEQYYLEKFVSCPH